MSSGVFDLGLIPRGAWASKEPVGPVSLSRRDPVRKLNHYYGICRGNVSPVRVILIIPVELELKGRLRLIIISFEKNCYCWCRVILTPDLDLEFASKLR